MEQWPPAVPYLRIAGCRFADHDPARVADREGGKAIGAYLSRCYQAFLVLGVRDAVLLDGLFDRPPCVSSVHVADLDGGSGADSGDAPTVQFFGTTGTLYHPPDVQIARAKCESER
jgi:hypothetical protein